MSTQPHMIVMLNYLITLLCFGCAYVLYLKGANYQASMKFMIFFGAAAFIGGIVHHVEIYDISDIRQAIANLNSNLPGFIAPLSLDFILTRLWFVTMVFIGFTEYYFVCLVIEPIMTGRLKWFVYYLRLMLLVFCMGMIVFNQYFLVVGFHIFTHAVIIIFAIIMYKQYKHKCFIYVILLAAYNLCAGVMQQFMENGIIPVGELNYNDWYHILICIFVLLVQWVLTRGGLIKTLNKLGST